MVVASRSRWLGVPGRSRSSPRISSGRRPNEAYDDEAYDYAIQRYKPPRSVPVRSPCRRGRAEDRAGLLQRGPVPGSDRAFGNFERMHPTSTYLPTTEYHRGLSYMAQYTTADRTSRRSRTRSTPSEHRRPVSGRPGRIARCCGSASAAKPWPNTKRRWRATISSARAGGAAESRLRGLLTEYPETDAAAETLYTFGQSYDEREEQEGAVLPTRRSSATSRTTSGSKDAPT
jgi:hypothetical protein